MTTGSYSSNVFVNCPFDDDYRDLFYAVNFSIFDCGYVPRCALEIDDSSQVRIDKITRIISDCKFGIHDISRTELGSGNNLPRFNMPFELGLFLGSKKFGTPQDRRKVCLILDKEPYRYQVYISDIAGQEIKAHHNESEKIIKTVRNWLRNSSGRRTIPGGTEIVRRFALFQTELSLLCEDLKLEPGELIFNEYADLVSEWLRLN